MESIRNKIVSVYAIFLITTLTFGQNNLNDNVMNIYTREKTEIEYIMKYYRIYGSVLLSTEYSYAYPRGTKRIYNGVDLSVNGMITTDVRKRIVQLLNDEYYPGEIDTMVNYIMNNDIPKGHNYYYIRNKKDEIIERLTKKYSFDLSDLIIFCGGLQDEEIKDLLIKAYTTNKYPENYNRYSIPMKSIILRALAEMGAEPYLSIYVDENKYNSEDSPEIMEMKIKKLNYIPRKETFLELSNYLFTDKYTVSITESDQNYEMEEDTTEITLIPYEIEVEEETYSESKEYIDTKAFFSIYYSLCNKELHDIVDDISKWINSEHYYSNEDIHILLTEKKRKRIYRWMKRNYDKYDFSNRW